MIWGMLKSRGSSLQDSSRKQCTLNYSGNAGCELSATMANLCAKGAMSAAATSLRIICSLCILKEERTRATDHILFKNRIIKTVHELNIKRQFLFISFFFSIIININNNNNNNNKKTEVVQELSL
jgi:hypothetical protein